MTGKTERVRSAIQGESVDRIPYSVWTHFPGIDLDPEALALATMAFYREFDLDFVKNMSNGLFSIEDWDCGCDFSEIARGGVAKATKLAVNDPSDWGKLSDLDIEKGALGRELRSLERLVGEMRGEAPVLATVFSPVTTAQKLSGRNLGRHILSDPDKVKIGLEIITSVTKRFAVRAIEAGAAGVYFASQLSQFGSMSEAQYREFGVPYDLPVLEAVGPGSWFNVLHIHGDDIMFNLLKDYPVQGISWHVWETSPSVEDFLAANTGKCIVGGLRRFKITEGALPEIEKDVEEMARITGGKRLFLAPGCVIRAPFDKKTLAFLKRAVARTGRAGDRL